MQQPAHLNMLDAARVITRGQVARMTDADKEHLAGELIGHCIVREGDKMPDEPGTGRITIVTETIRAFALIADHIPSAALEFAAVQMGIAGEEGIESFADLLEDVLSEAGLGDWVIWRPNPAEPGCRVTTEDYFDQYLESLRSEGEGGEMGTLISTILAHVSFAGFRTAPKTHRPVVVRRIYDTEDDVTGITDAERNIRERLGLPTGEKVPAEEVAGMPRPEAEEKPVAEPTDCPAPGGAEA